MDQHDESRHLQHLEDDLVRELHLEPDVVHAAVTRVLADFEAAPVRDFVPVLAARRVRQELLRPA
jgi:hypothetical protein